MSFVVRIDPERGVPPYEQIRDAVVEGARNGDLPTGTRLPSVRRLAEDLGLAVNTVAKAYKALESEGHVATRGRHGTVVLPPADARAPDDVSDAAARFVDAAHGSGLDLDAALGVVRRVWRG